MAGAPTGSSGQPELRPDEVVAVGLFSSLGSFSALFTRRIGATPSASQRRSRGLVHVPGALPRTRAAAAAR